MKVVEQVHAADVADGQLGLAGAEGEGLEDVALAGPTLARDEQVLAALDESEACQIEDQGPIELGLEWPFESFQGLARAQAARRTTQGWTTAETASPSPFRSSP